ncbi:hypothetical protein BCR39DRAFT_470972 [Naematelia encephala]|uniref:G-protein coupled receptors family 1 profile domain-containing protein n=1 Tax=Naematelia encephala TaxID=71784 RepID=A0A1Y2ATM1_9TREE|nr:hypothetical protein BCR39DRAFT_470972 [Naematelia encephala]
MVAWTYINAVGGSIISGLTVLASVYLMVSLARQGRGKLRVRLLLGMVISDLLVGLIVFPQEFSYLVKHPLTPGNACNTVGFLFTAIVFSQHLWTLSIAFATFLLLKYPLSKTTTILDRYSYFAAPIIWAISFAQSGIWWATVGWRPSGATCYYGSHLIHGSSLDARDLVQFIPRGFVFLVVVALYTRLFSFLRRPDTIQLSSPFVSGTATDGEDHRLGVGNKLLKPFQWRRQRTSIPSNGGGTVDAAAPWEQMEFVQIGGRRNIWSPTQTQNSFNHYPQMISHAEILQPTLGSPVKETKDPFVTELHREASGSDSTVVPESSGSDQPPSESETLAAPELQYAPTNIKRPSTTTTLAPVFSEERTGATGARAGRRRRPSGQTLKEFFQENQIASLDGREQRTSASHGNGTGGMQMSATAYFNRQASLLMLYFPLAYLTVFSISLVRLVYDMVNHQPSPVLALLSGWMVVSVGLIDGLVYGFAEYMVRRRVRRKMPEQFNI